MVMLFTYAYYVTLSSATIYSAFVFKQSGKAGKAICMLIWLGCVTEAAGYLCRRIYQTNYPVYNVSLFWELIFTCLYFNCSIETFKRYNLGWYISAAGITYGIYNTICIHSVFIFNDNFLFLVTLIVICISLFSIFEQVARDEECRAPLWGNTVFWLPCMLLFNRFGSLWIWGIYNTLQPADKMDVSLLDIALLAIGIVTYACLPIILFFSPRKPHDVQP